MKRGKFQFTVRRWRRRSGGGGKREGFQECKVFGPEGIKSHMIIKQRKSKRSCSDLPNDLEQDETQADM